MMWAFKLAVAGLGPMVWHWGVGVGAIILLVVGAELTTAIPLIGPWLEKVRKDLLWVAVGIALVLVGEWVGGHDMKARYEAKQAVIGEQVDQAVQDAQDHPALDKWDTDK